MNNPLVSVIIPTYDRANELQGAVDSVVGQTYEKIELIIVDDCSTHPVADVFERRNYEPSVDMNVIRHDENKGANAARNTGLRRAEGEFIAFLDDDDWWEPEKLEKQIASFRENDPLVGVVYTGIKLHHEDGTTVTRISDAEGDVTEEMLLGNPVGSFSVVMVRAEAIRVSGLPDEELPNAQDREWYIRLSRDWLFVPIREPLVNIREAGSSADRLSLDLDKRMNVSYPRIIEKHRTLAREHGLLFERKMVAQFSFQIGYLAFRRRRFNTARFYMLKALAYYPLNWRYYVGFVAAIGGTPLAWVAGRVNADWRARIKRAYFSFLH